MFTRSTVFVLGKIVWMEMIKLNCFLLVSHKESLQHFYHTTRSVQ